MQAQLVLIVICRLLLPGCSQTNLSTVLCVDKTSVLAALKALNCWWHRFRWVFSLVNSPSKVDTSSFAGTALANLRLSFDLDLVALDVSVFSTFPHSQKLMEIFRVIRFCISGACCNCSQIKPTVFSVRIAGLRKARLGRTSCM